MATVVLTTGVAGTGKSYRRAAVEIFNFLLDGGGAHWSNFPFYPDKIARECASRTGKPAETYLRRIKRIPKAELDSWERSYDRPQSHLCRGPFTYFKPIPWPVWESGELDKLSHGWAGKDFPETVVRFASDDGDWMAGINLVGAHVAIDECHNFCKASGSTPKHQREMWGQWLGEIRHIGATVEFLTQSPHKLAEEIVKEAEVRIDLLNVESERDPFFKIPMSDWYELKAGLLTGEYEAKVQLLERRCVEGRWVKHYSEFFRRDPFYFQFYNSYNKPQAGGVNAPSKVYEFQKRSQKSLLLWFFKRNAWPVSSRILLSSFVVWLCFLGGGRFLFNRFVGIIQGVTAANSVPENAAPVPAKSAKPVPERPERRPLPDRSVGGYLPDPVRPAPPSASPHAGRTVLPEREVLKYSIRMLTPESIVFSDRNHYAIGDTIETGPLKGEQIHEIDYVRRRIRTSKRVLLLGDVIEQVKELPLPPAEKENNENQ
jgi:hypothetical protein